MAQFARPDADITTTGWTPSTASTHFDDLDEATASDADHTTSDATAGRVYRCGLSNVTDPAASTGHILRVRMGRTVTTAGTADIRLYQGSTLIAEFLNEVVPAGPSVGNAAPATVAKTLSAAQADAITDYAALEVEYTADDNRHRITWIEFEVPDTAGNPRDLAAVAAGAASVTAVLTKTVNMAAALSGVAAIAAALSKTSPGPPVENVETASVAANATGPTFTIPTTDITPVANQPLVLVFGGKGSGGTTPDAESVSGCNLTWVRLRYKPLTNSGFISVWVGMGSAPTTGKLTITLSQTTEAGRAGYSIFRGVGLDTSNGGTNILAAAYFNATAGDTGLNLYIQEPLVAGNVEYAFLFGFDGGTYTFDPAWTLLGEQSNGDTRTGAWWNDDGDLQASPTWASTSHTMACILEFRLPSSPPTPAPEPVLLGRGSAPTHGTTKATSLITPSADVQQLVAVFNERGSSPAIPTLTGCNLTWEQVLTFTFPAGSGTWRMTLFKARGPSPVQGTPELAFTTSGNKVGWQFYEVPAVLGVLQSASGSVAAGTALGATLAAAPAADSIVMGFMAWDVKHDTRTTEPAPENGYQNAEKPLGAAGLTENMVWRWTGEQSPSVTLTAAANGGMIALEVEPEPPPVGVDRNFTAGLVAAGATAATLTKTSGGPKDLAAVLAGAGAVGAALTKTEATGPKDLAAALVGAGQVSASLTVETPGVKPPPPKPPKPPGYVHEISTAQGSRNPVLGDDWENTEVAPGGYESASGTVDADEVLSHPEVYRVGATWRVFDAGSGEEVWSGDLLEPEVNGPVATLAARGGASIPEEETERLLFATDDLDLWVAQDAEPHEYGASEKIEVEAQGSRMQFKVPKDTVFKGGAGTWANGMVLFAPDQPLQRFTARLHKSHGQDAYTLQLLGGVGPSGSLTLIQEWNLGAATPTGTDLTASWTAEYDQVVLRLRRTGDTKKARKFKTWLTKVRVYGLAAVEDYTTADVVREVAGLESLDDRGVWDGPTEVLPLDADGTHADLLTEMALLEDYRWLVRGGVLDFGPWNIRVWRILDPDADVVLIPLKRYNQVRIPYRRPGGVQSYLTVRAEPNPFPPGFDRTYDVELDDPLPPEDVAQAFAENILGRLAEEKAGGDARLAWVTDSQGVLRPAGVMHAGDVIETPAGARLRVKELQRTEHQVEVTFDDGHAVLERWLARRRVFLARGRRSAAATLAAAENDDPAAPATPTLTFPVEEGKYQPTVAWAAVANDLEGNPTAVDRYIVQLQAADGNWVVKHSHKQTVDEPGDESDPDDSYLSVQWSHIHNPDKWRYRGRVRAVDYRGAKGPWSGWSDWKRATASTIVPPAPINLVVRLGLQALNARWEAPADPEPPPVGESLEGVDPPDPRVEHFEVEWSTDSTFTTVVRRERLVRANHSEHKAEEPMWVRVRSVSTSGEASAWVSSGPHDPLQFLLAAAIKTAVSGGRVEFDRDGIRMYDPANNLVVNMETATGNVTLVGSLATGFSGRYWEILDEQIIAWDDSETVAGGLYITPTGLELYPPYTSPTASSLVMDFDSANTQWRAFFDHLSYLYIRNPSFTAFWLDADNYIFILEERTAHPTSIRFGALGIYGFEDGTRTRPFARDAGGNRYDLSRVMSGTGSPEGVVTAPVGTMYTRTDGGAGTTLYVKESGTGNTGWVAK